MTANLIKITSEELTQVLAAHELWRESEGKKGKRAVLRGVDLGNRNFYRINFYGATLRESSFRNAYLIGASFAWADIRNADFTGAIMFYGYKLIKTSMVDYAKHTKLE